MPSPIRALAPSTVETSDTMIPSIGNTSRIGGFGPGCGIDRRRDGGHLIRSIAQPTARNSIEIDSAGSPISNQVTEWIIDSVKATEIAIGDQTSIEKKPWSSATFIRSSRIATTSASPPAASSVLARLMSVPSSVTAPMLSAMPNPCPPAAIARKRHVGDWRISQLPARRTARDVRAASRSRPSDTRRATNAVARSSPVPRRTRQSAPIATTATADAAAAAMKRRSVDRVAGNTATSQMTSSDSATGRRSGNPTTVCASTVKVNATGNHRASHLAEDFDITSILSRAVAHAGKPCGEVLYWERVRGESG